MGKDVDLRPRRDPDHRCERHADERSRRRRARRVRPRSLVTRRRARDTALGMSEPKPPAGKPDVKVKKPDVKADVPASAPAKLPPLDERRVTVAELAPCVAQLEQMEAELVAMARDGR